MDGARTFVVAQGHPRASDRNPGTADRPWRTISRAAGRGVLRPGDTVRVHAGTYRETVEPREGGRRGARVAFVAAKGERVVVSGAEPAPDWAPAATGLWRRPWTGGALPIYADDHDERRVFRREMVIARGEPLREAPSREAIAPGQFWAEGPPEAPTALLARFPDGATPEAARAEVAVRTYLFKPLGPDPYAPCGDPETPGYFHLRGIAFRYATNRAQWGAVCAGSEGSLVEDVRVEWTNGQGIDGSGRDHAFLRTAADHNGQMGWGAACTGCLWRDTQAVGNNWKGYSPFWEAGGGKWVRTTDTVIRRHLAKDNGGPGIWLDIDNADNTIEASRAEGNAVAGIMLELRTVRTLVQHNTVTGTRWEEWSGSGILSQAASENVLLHNTVTGSEGTGIWLRLDPLRRARDGGTWVVANRLAGNARGDGSGAVEAREIASEGTDARHVRTHRFRHNALWPLAAPDPGMRSAFFVHPTPGGDYRGSDLGLWRRYVDDEGSRLTRGALGVRPLALPAAGAPRAPARWAETAGAHAAAVGLE